MLGVGYTIGAVSPFVLGAVRDLTGSFDAVLWVCAGFLALLACSFASCRRAKRSPVAARCQRGLSCGTGRPQGRAAVGGLQPQIPSVTPRAAA